MAKLDLPYTTLCLSLIIQVFSVFIIMLENGKSVKTVLQEKHPDAASIDPEALINSPLDFQQDFYPSLFDNITPEIIRACALHTEGTPGPSGVDAVSWRRFCMAFREKSNELCVDAVSWRRFCTAFGEKSNELCAAVAALAKRIATTYVDPVSLVTYTACKLIQLNKNPGVRPIGVGEVLRRIVGKAVSNIAKLDLLESMGPLQLCAGQNVGCEAACHAMSKIFDDDTTEAVIFVDATNAFNSLNRQVTLHNCKFICPALCPILINTYHEPSLLFVVGETLLSREGTTQGDPLAMSMYAIGTRPLIQKLQGIAKQLWYADDLAAGSNIPKLREWWDMLSKMGPLYGYNPKSSKTCLLVKPDFIDSARRLFGDTGIHISSDGHHYLGCPIGNISFLKKFVSTKISQWSSELETPPPLQLLNPMLHMHVAFAHGLSSK